MANKERKVRIDEALYDEIAQVVAHSVVFDSVDEYVNSVLRELLQAGDDSSSSDDVRLQERLRDLGYL